MLCRDPIVPGRSPRRERGGHSPPPVSQYRAALAAEQEGEEKEEKEDKEKRKKEREKEKERDREKEKEKDAKKEEEREIRRKERQERGERRKQEGEEDTQDEEEEGVGGKSKRTEGKEQRKGEGASEGEQERQKRKEQRRKEREEEEQANHETKKQLREAKRQMQILEDSLARERARTAAANAMRAAPQVRFPLPCFHDALYLWSVMLAALTHILCLAGGGAGSSEGGERPSLPPWVRRTRQYNRQRQEEGQEVELRAFQHWRSG